ncbi:MAG: prohibitin family protein [Rickettsiales bacterium]
MNNTFLLKLFPVFLIIGLVFAMSPFTIVDTGHRGVRVVWGKVQPESLDEGLYFFMPIMSTIKKMDVRIQKYDIESEAYTKDVQQAKLHIVMNYNLEKTKAHEMLENVGSDWEDRLIPQAVNGTVKAVIGKWDAVDLIANRSKAQGEIQALLTESLGGRDVHVTRIEIANIDYTPEFERAVEAKVVAIQTAEQEKNKTVQIQEQAKQRVMSAKAEAESMSIRAQALSQNKSLVEYEAVQKWDGRLPNYMLGGATPFVNISSENNTQK